MHRFTVPILAASASFALAGASMGASTVIKYNEVSQGTESGFGFSLIHTPTNDSGAGSLLYRMFSSMTVVWDDVADTLTFTSFQGDLYEENNFNPNNLGDFAGTVELRESSALNLQQGTDDNTFMGDAFVKGLLKLTLSLDGEASRDLDIEFKALHYNALANRFDPDNGFALGLWGATPEVFNGAIDGDSLGFDVFGTNGQVIPLPTAANLGLFGFAALGAGAGLRRRR